MNAAWSIPRIRSIAAGIVAAIVVCAFVAAPRSCEGGLDFYFGAGVVAVVALAALPLTARADRTIGGCIASGAGYAVFGVAVWILGLFVANVRIMCRLF